MWRKIAHLIWRTHKSGSRFGNMEKSPVLPFKGRRRRRRRLASSYASETNRILNHGRRRRRRRLGCTGPLRAPSHALQVAAAVTPSTMGPAWRSKASQPAGVRGRRRLWPRPWFSAFSRRPHQQSQPQGLLSLVAPGAHSPVTTVATSTTIMASVLAHSFPVGVDVARFRSFFSLPTLIFRKKRALKPHVLLFYSK